MKKTLLLLLAGGCSLVVKFKDHAESGAQCFDGIDNDSSGEADCADPSCADECQPDGAPRPDGKAGAPDGEPTAADGPLAEADGALSTDADLTDAFVADASPFDAFVADAGSRPDCNGDYGGSAYLDPCGQCVGGNTGAVSGCQDAVLEPVADAWIDSSQTDVNHGFDLTLSVNSSVYNAEGDVLLKFDLAVLPPGSSIKTAQLYMTAEGGFAYDGDGNVYVSPVFDDTWSEGTVTWLNRPTNIATPVGYWWLWYDGTPGRQIGMIDTLELAQTIDSELRGDQLFSVQLNSPGYDTNYDSREASDKTVHPQLVVHYLPAGP